MIGVFSFLEDYSLKRDSVCFSKRLEICEKSMAIEHHFGFLEALTTNGANRWNYGESYNAPMLRE